MVKITRQRILFYFLVDALLKITSLSDAWLVVSPLPSSRHHISLCCRSTSGPIEDESSQTRRSMLQFGSLLTVVGTMLASPLVVSAAEVDPFAVMDDMLSTGTTALPSSLNAPPGNPITNDENGNKAGTDTKTNPTTTSPNSGSDMAAALQESKKRRTVDPRTHG